MLDRAPGIRQRASRRYRAFAPRPRCEAAMRILDGQLWVAHYCAISSGAD